MKKSDLADPVWNKKWVEYFAAKGMGVLEINSRTGMGIKSIQGLVQEVCKDKIERDRKRGIVNRPVRAMVVGIPNVGKSTFINSFAGKACAKTGNKPGVTKGKQWIRLNKGLELLDTPGILWPKFEDQQVGMRLAFIGSMNDEILIPDELACDLIGAIKELYPKALQERYAADPVGKPIEILEAVAESRKCYSKGEQLEEAWGTGTAAVISPIGELFYNDKGYFIADNKIGPVSQKLYDTLTGIQWGTAPDTFGWVEPVC